MKRAALLIGTLALGACAEPRADLESSASYSLSLVLLDLSAAVLLRDAPTLQRYLSSSFTLNQQTWKPDPLIEALRRTVQKVSVLEATFVPAGGGPALAIPLTRVEPDSELVKVWRRQPPHEALKIDARALARLGSGTVRGVARGFPIGGSTIEADFTLRFRIDGDEVRVQSLDFAPR